MAKADLSAITIREKRQKYGDVLRRTSEIARMNRDETADALQVDKAQISRWWSGEENPQTWRYHQHPRLRECYLLAQAEADGNVELETVVRIRRRA
jgi:hypothetical protein